MKTIEINKLTKRYGSLEAVKEVSFELEQGKIYGLLGRNGAGKSTLMKMITDRLIIDEGRILYDGREGVNDQVLEQIYHIEMENYFPESAKIKDMIRMTEICYPSFDRSQAIRDCESFEIGLNKKMIKLSTGMKTAVKNILALNSGASFVILDEPTLGLDAVGREFLYERILEEFAKGDQTFILSTHLIEEVSSLVEEVIFIDRGRILLQENVEELLPQYVQLSGSQEAIDQVLNGTKPVSRKNMAGLQTVICKRPENLQVDDRITISPVELQSLFVAFTGSIRK